MAYHSARWYMYDSIYKLLGAADSCDANRSADRIIPELQDLKVGDTIKIFEQAPFDVVALEPNPIPSASSGQARTWSSSFLGRCVLRVSGNLNFPEERSCDTISIGSAKSSGREHYTENLWSMQTMGASRDTFFIVTCSRYLCRGVL